jgi:hypothetical protein
MREKLTKLEGLVAEAVKEAETNEATINGLRAELAEHVTECAGARAALHADFEAEFKRHAAVEEVVHKRLSSDFDLAAARRHRLVDYFYRLQKDLDDIKDALEAEEQGS